MNSIAYDVIIVYKLEYMGLQQKLIIKTNKRSLNSNVNWDSLLIYIYLSSFNIDVRFY